MPFSLCAFAQACEVIAFSAKECPDSAAEAVSAGALEAIVAALNQNQGEQKCLYRGFEAVEAISLGRDGARRAGEAGCARTPCDALDSFWRGAASD